MSLLVCPRMSLPVFWSPAENKAKACFINCAVPSCSEQNILILAPDDLIKSSQAKLSLEEVSASAPPICTG